jgi:GNAT superfamily N-acetyltransferase
MSDRPIAYRAEVIDENSIHFHDIVALGKKNSATLGFMPKGGFFDYAHRGRIIVLTDDEKRLLGYLMYRVTSGRAFLVHFCIREEKRGRGLAHKLASRLFDETRHLDGVGLYCRRDFDANKRWPKLGFTAVTERLGRGRDPKRLTFWWRGNQHQDLLSAIAPEERREVVIDTNIFIDLHGHMSGATELSRCLQADWVAPLVELAVTPELSNEIVRGDDDNERSRLLSAQLSYKHIGAAPELVKLWVERLREYFPAKMSASLESDLRHLAHCAASGSNLFVTRDAELQAICDASYKETGVEAKSPVEFVTQLDGEERPHAYKPVLLAGSRIRVEPLDAVDLDAVSAQFLRTEHGERRSEFKQALANALSQPRALDCRAVRRPDGTIVAIYAMSCCPGSGGVAEIPVLRFEADNLGQTLARHILRDAVQDFANMGAGIVRYSEQRFGPATELALKDAGFEMSGDAFVRVCARGVLSVLDIGVALNRLKKIHPQHLDLFGRIETVLNNYSSHSDAAQACAIERQLWPGKVDCDHLPTFIVPIRPQYALSLFDRELAAQQLFGPKEPIFAKEAVYFRSPRGAKLCTPARIVWYVSKGGRQAGPMSARACSRLEEVVVDEAKTLYRKFRRLSVYEWENIKSHTCGSAHEPIMMLRFADTEYFKSSVDAGQLRELGVRGTIQSPRSIDAATFRSIYKLGMGCKDAW